MEWLDPKGESIVPRIGQRKAPVPLDAGEVVTVDAFVMGGFVVADAAAAASALALDSA